MQTLATSFDQTLSQMRDQFMQWSRTMETLRLQLPQGMESLLLEQAGESQPNLTDEWEALFTSDAKRRLHVAQLRVGEYFTEGRDKAHAVLPLDHADERVAKFAAAFIKAAHSHGIPCMATEIYRGQDRQNALRAAGKSRAKWGESAHNYGKAVDLVHGTKAWDMTAPQWNLFGIIGKEVARRQKLKMTWGGDWSFYDPAHWELSTWKAEPRQLP